jgi:hypothetical protein
MKIEEKALVSKDIIGKVGIATEEMLEGAEKTAAEAKGAKEALFQHVKNLLGIVEAVDAEVDKTLDLPTASLIKKWLMKTVHATENYARHFINVELSAIGESNGLKRTHDLLQRMASQIDSKVIEFHEALERGDIILGDDGMPIAKPGKPRPVGVRPGQTIKQQRLAEEAAAKGGNGVDLDSMSPEELEQHLLG